MPYIHSVGTALPEHVVEQRDVRAVVEPLFGEALPHLDRLLTVFDNSGIERRHFCAPLEWYSRPHGAAERHRMYVAHALSLAEQAAVDCLQKAGLAPSDIDHIFYVSTTGFSTPSIDAHLFNRIGLNGHVKRTPIWGLGCAGGAAGLSRAFEYTTAFPNHRALLISVELCSLTFIPNDASKSNLVATCLFGDGAAAALVCGDQCGQRGPSVRGSFSTIWPDSLDVMGWEVTDDGLKVVFSRDIPTIVMTEMRANVLRFLDRQQLTMSDIRNVVLHPGGMKVLDAYQASLELPDGSLSAAYDVLRQCGNMSSCTVLFVLEEMMRTRALKPGYGLLGALGPGFSSELVLLHVGEEMS